MSELYKFAVDGFRICFMPSSFIKNRNTNGLWGALKLCLMMVCIFLTFENLVLRNLDIYPFSLGAGQMLYNISRERMRKVFDNEHKPNDKINLQEPLLVPYNLLVSTYKPDLEFAQKLLDNGRGLDAYFYLQKLQNDKLHILQKNTFDVFEKGLSTTPVRFTHEENINDKINDILFLMYVDHQRSLSDEDGKTQNAKLLMRDVLFGGAGGGETLLQVAIESITAVRTANQFLPFIKRYFPELEKEADNEINRYNDITASLKFKIAQEIFTAMIIVMYSFIFYFFIRKHMSPDVVLELICYSIIFANFWKWISYAVLQLTTPILSFFNLWISGIVWMIAFNIMIFLAGKVFNYNLQSKTYVYANSTCLLTTIASLIFSTVLAKVVFS